MDVTEKVGSEVALQVAAGDGGKMLIFGVS